MERIKRIFNEVFNYQALSDAFKVSEDNKFEHIVTIDEVEARTRRTETNLVKCGIRRKYKLALLIVDLFLYSVIVLLWVTVFNILLRLMVQTEKTSSQEFLYFGYFAMIMVITLSGIYFETLILRSFERLTPKYAFVVRKSRRNYVLRLRIVGDKEFVETELDENKLTFDNVFEICCKELELKKEDVKHLRKMPDTKIRSESDVKRFHRLEYVEVITY